MHSKVRPGPRILDELVFPADPLVGFAVIALILWVAALAISTWASPPGSRERCSPRLPALGRLPERQETASQRQGCPQDRKVYDANRTGDPLALSLADRAHSHRHAMCVRCPSESCRRACSSGVECARITQRNATVATVNTTNA